MLAYNKLSRDLQIHPNLSFACPCSQDVWLEKLLRLRKEEVGISYGRSGALILCMWFICYLCFPILRANSDINSTKKYSRSRRKWLYTVADP